MNTERFARLFISLAVPGKTRKAIKSRTSALRGSLRHIRWEPEEKLHLTLRFLGRTRREEIPAIRAALAETCATFPAFAVQTTGVKALARRRYPETLAVMTDEPDGLFNLKSEIDRTLEGVGFDPESRDFLPHITIGRARKRMRPPEFPQFELDFTANRVCLMESKLRREGARHTEIEGWELASPMPGSPCHRG